MRFLKYIRKRLLREHILGLWTITFHEIGWVGGRCLILSPILLPT